MGGMSMNEDKGSVKNGIIVNRVLIAVTMVMLLLFMAVSGVFAYRIYGEYAKIRPVVESISKVDFKEMEKALASIDKDTVAKITEAIDSVSELSQSIDAKKLEEALDELTGAAEDLSQLKEALSPILKFFGN